MKAFNFSPQISLVMRNKFKVAGVDDDTIFVFMSDNGAISQGSKDQKLSFAKKFDFREG